MKVVILGNSIALRMRPPRSDPSHATYAEHLERAGYNVTATARAGTLLSEAFASLEEDVISIFPDVVILHYGVVEVCYRQTVRSINNRTIRNYYLNSRFGRSHIPDTPRHRLTLLLWRTLNGCIRRTASLCGLRWQWMQPDRFMEVMYAATQVILKETHAHVLIIGLNPPSERIDRILGGSIDAIARTNARLAEWSSQQGPRLSFLEPETFFPKEHADALAPDGIHFSAHGHRMLAEAILHHLRVRHLT